LHACPEADLVFAINVLATELKRKQDAKKSVWSEST